MIGRAGLVLAATGVACVVGYLWRRRARGDPCLHQEDDACSENNQEEQVEIFEEEEEDAMREAAEAAEEGIGVEEGNEVAEEEGVAEVPQRPRIFRPPGTGPVASKEALEQREALLLMRKQYAKQLERGGYYPGRRKPRGPSGPRH